MTTKCWEIYGNLRKCYGNLRRPLVSQDMLQTEVSLCQRSYHVSQVVWDHDHQVNQHRWRFAELTIKECEFSASMEIFHHEEWWYNMI